MKTEFERYTHHDRLVSVRKELKGKHREHCLCFSCAGFIPENIKENCPIANELYNFDVEHGLVTPVWECPQFFGKSDK